MFSLVRGFPQSTHPPSTPSPSSHDLLKETPHITYPRASSPPSPNDPTYPSPLPMPCSAAPNKTAPLPPRSPLRLAGIPSSTKPNFLPGQRYLTGISVIPHGYVCTLVIAPSTPWDPQLGPIPAPRAIQPSCGNLAACSRARPFGQPVKSPRWATLRVPSPSRGPVE